MNNNLPSLQLKIRPGSLDDILSIQNIVSKTWPATYNSILGEAQVYYMIRKFYSSTKLEEQMKNQHYFFMALREDQPVGFASYSRVDDGIFKLQKIYVLPGEQKTGTGKALLLAVETAVKNSGASTLLLNVNRENKARYFYEKRGFTIIKEEDIDIENGFFMNDYVMKKLL